MVRQDYSDRYRDPCDVILQGGRGVGLNSEYSTSKWELIAKEQNGRSVDGKLLRGNTRGKAVSG